MAELPTKPKCANVVHIVRKLGGTVAGNCQWKLIDRNSRTIISHAQQCLAATTGHDLNAGRASVDSIFDKFLDNAGGAFDDFPAAIWLMMVSLKC